jgi:hypothetical protein
MSALKWITLDPTVSPTSASGKLCYQLAQRGDNPINMGQGNEIEVPPEDIRPHWQGQSGPAYNIDVGGPKASKEAMARMLHDFYGIPADGDNTFVLQSNGRSGLLNLLSVVTRRADVANSSIRPVVYM